MVNFPQMKPSVIVFIAALYALPMMPQTVSGHAPSRNASPKHFESGIGFSYDVPSDLAIISSKQFDRAMQAKATQLATTGQEMKSINCTQRLLVAENRDESKIVVFLAAPQGCATGIVTDKTLSSLGQYAANELSKRFAVVKPVYGAFTAGKHAFWAMQSEMTPNPPQNPNHEVAYLVTYTPDFVIECMLLARTPADLSALVNTHLKFEDGTETELLPSDAFVAK